jgi:hypothetical protein
MGVSIILRRIALWIGPLLVALLVAGCAGIKPYKPHDYREDGLKSGLFSGSKGEFIIYKKVDEPETGSEIGKSSDEAVDSEQQKQPEKPTDGYQ